MQMTGLGDAVGRVGERRRRRRRAELAQPQLAREQVGADEAQRPGEQKQQVVTNQRRHGARAEEARRAVAEQRVRERQAERMRVEDVGVEQVQRVVQHAVADVGDLPGRAHRIAQVRRDAAGHVQHQRPARQHGERHAYDDHPDDLARAQLGRGQPARTARAFLFEARSAR